MLADLGVVEKRIEKLRTTGRHGTPAEREANERELEVLERIVPGAARGQPIRDMELTDDESQAHPRLPLPDREAGAGAAQHRRGRRRRALRELVADFAARYKHRQSRVEALSARIEMEIGQLDDGGGGSLPRRTWA